METEHTINGVSGLMFARSEWANGLHASQVWKASRYYGKGNRYRLAVELRFDDQCRNGAQSFAITADLFDKQETREGGWVAGGCLHEDIARRFPELRELVPYHLCDTRGPMHYAANVVYFAGDRDHNGLRKGETRQIRNGRSGALAWRRAIVDTEGREIELTHADKYMDAETAPAAIPCSVSYLPWLRIGEGKDRELDKARRAAIWPDATDAQLCAEPDQLRAALAERLPRVVAEFRRLMVDVCGFEWREVPQ